MMDRAIVVALARTAMANKPTPAVRRQVERLHEAWAARGETEGAQRLADILNPPPLPPELANVRLVQSAP